MQIEKNNVQRSRDGRIEILCHSWVYIDGFIQKTWNTETLKSTIIVYPDEDALYHYNCPNETNTCTPCRAHWIAE